jgi:hypothetical protein
LSACRCPAAKKRALKKSPKTVKEPYGRALLRNELFEHTLVLACRFPAASKRALLDYQQRRLAKEPCQSEKVLRKRALQPAKSLAKVPH